MGSLKKYLMSSVSSEFSVGCRENQQHRNNSLNFNFKSNLPELKSELLSQMKKYKSSFSSLDKSSTFLFHNKLSIERKRNFSLHSNSQKKIEVHEIFIKSKIVRNVQFSTIVFY